MLGANVELIQVHGHFLIHLPTPLFFCLFPLIPRHSKGENSSVSGHTYPFVYLCPCKEATSVLWAGI